MLWLADRVPVRNDPVRWVATSVGVLMLVAVLGLWLAATGEASEHALADRAARLTDGVHLVALTFLVLFHTLTDRSTPRWYARGATLLAVGFGVILAAGAQISFPEAPWTEWGWVQLALFVGAGVAMHCALASREPTGTADDL